MPVTVAFSGETYPTPAATVTSAETGMPVDYVYGPAVAADPALIETVPAGLGEQFGLFSWGALDVTEVIFNHVHAVAGLDLNYNSLVSVKFPLLEDVDVGNTQDGYLWVRSSSLTVFEAPLLRSVAGGVTIRDTLLTTINLPSLVHAAALEATGNANLTALALPVCSALGALQLEQNGFTTLAFSRVMDIPTLIVVMEPALTLLDMTAIAGDMLELNIRQNPVLTTILLPEVTDITTTVTCYENTLLTTLTFGSLSSLTAAIIAIYNNPALVALNFNGAFFSAAHPNLNFSGCAYNQATVDLILKAARDGNGTNGTLLLDGGTNAHPSATGLGYRTTLQGRGWTVTIN